MHETEYTGLNESVQNKFIELKENYSAVNSIYFMNYFRHLPKKVMLENVSCLYEMNSNIGIDFLNQLIESSDWNDNQLLECKSNIISFMSDNDHNERLNETVTLIDSLIEENKSMENIRNEVLFNLYDNRFKSYCTFESYLHNELDIVIYNINYSPETIYDLESIVRKIKTENLSEIISSFPKLLSKSTQMIKSISIVLTGDVLELVVSVPTAIADRLVEGSVDKAQIKLYIKMIDKEIVSISKTIKGEGRPQLYNMYSAYLRSLVNAKKMLSKVSTKSVTESITEMQPDIVYSESVLDDLTGEIEELSTMLIFDEDDEINTESFDQLVRLAKTYNCLYEKANPVIRAANRVADGGRKVSNKIVDTSKDVKRTQTAINKSFEPLVNMFNNTINKIKEADKKDRTEQIITGQYKFKLTRIIRKGILAIAGAGVGVGVAKVGGKVVVGGVKALASVVNPVLVAIGILAAIGIDKKINAKHRKAVLSDLEAELRIVTEKIEDAKSDGDKEAKYELMRIQNKLKKDIDRIKFGLKE